MPLYDITDAAEADIREIVSYTLKNWGVAQTNIHRKAIKDTFELIGRKTVVIRKFLQIRFLIYSSQNASITISFSLMMG